MALHDLDDLKRHFRHLAEFCQGQSPLYAALSARVAEDPEVLELAAGGQRGQPPPNLLFGAVHTLLLDGTEHPLSHYYPSLGGTGRPEDAYPAFADFCRAFRDPIVEIVNTRRVQTNDVGRCAMLLPAVSLGWSRIGQQPLHLIEIGASAGLNLFLDRYHYEYTLPHDGNRIHTCGPDAPVRLQVEVRGEHAAPLPKAMPEITGRVGVDINPVDITREPDSRWLEALIWPDQPHRIARLQAATRLARQTPPVLVKGDGIDALERLVEQVPDTAVPLVFHSHTTFQETAEWRDRFAALLADLGRGRDLVYVSLEWLPDEPGPQLRMTVFSDGTPTASHLADCHSHGAWLRWLAE